LDIEIEKILGDFGLLAVFRCQPSELQADYFALINAVEGEDLRRERIAVMLDDLDLARTPGERSPQLVTWAAQP
jgi:hypothetical protein